MRVAQPEGERGSLKWIQLAVEQHWPSLSDPILAATKGKHLQWLSPLRHDDFAEYRDRAFLSLLGLERLGSALDAFWPRSGPQWDALGKVDHDTVILVEAKAHIGEFCSPATAAGEASRAQIAASFAKVAQAIGARPRTSWCDVFYQLANRLAHLWFLRSQGIEAYLALVGFTGDEDMKGPQFGETWEGAYQMANYVLGIPARNPLSPFIVHIQPRVPA